MKAAAELIERYLDEDLTQPEIDALQEWLRSDAEHAKEFVIAVHQHRTMRAHFAALQVAEKTSEAADGSPSESNEFTRVRSPKRTLPRLRLLRPGYVFAGMAVVATAIACFLVFAKTPTEFPSATVTHGRFATIEPPSTLTARISRSLSGSPIRPLSLLGRWLDRFAPKGFAPGSVIRVGRESAVRIGYTNEPTVIKVKENTAVIVRASRSGKRFELLSGALEIEAAPQQAGKPMRISTPRAEVKVMGTKLLVAAGGKSTRVRVAEGTVQLTPDDRKQASQVGAGQIAIARADTAITLDQFRPITNHFGTGSILREIWLDVRGMMVSDLLSHTNFPDRPNGRALLSIFETPEIGSGIDLYGARFRGYVHPPVTGNYTFWISADDAAELWLSTDHQSEGKRLICYLTQWSPGFHNWWQYPEQESAPVHLEAGKRYYIEALHKEGGGGDFLSVAWQPPGSDMEVIRGADLSPVQAQD